MLSLRKLLGQPEVLRVSEGAGWRPEKGAEKVDALKGYRIREAGLPSILQLHLKRFHYDWQRDVMEKINAPVSFPLELDLSKIIISNNNTKTTKLNKTNKTIYDLQSVLIHAGQFGGGHYYAYVRPNIHSEQWYRFDDQIVTPVSLKDVMVDGTGGPVKASSLTVSKRRPLWRSITRFLRRSITRIFEPKCTGYGGHTSCAYVLQYVKRSAIPDLYN